MLRITKSADSYREEHPLTIGILTRNSLDESWGLLGEIRAVLPEVPAVIWYSADQGDEASRRVHEFSRASLIRSEFSCTPGCSVNEIISRSLSPCTFIIWSDMSPANSTLLSCPEAGNQVCTAVRLEEEGGGILPSIAVPFLEDRHAVFSWETEGRKTLFPYDFTGFYDTPQFQSIQGYCESFINPFWQLADFGTRAYLWGYEISVFPSCRIAYKGQPTVYHQSKDIDYIRWFRRNCSMKRGRKFLKTRRTGLSQRAAEEQKWVEAHAHRFMRSIEEVIASWDQL